MIRYIVIRTQFEATHAWPECPHDSVAFLRTPHRHMFHVEMKFKVDHNNRDLEFIMMKRLVEDYIGNHFQGRDLGRMSCEDVAEELLSLYPIAVMASVFEDNENGAEIWKEK